MIDDNTEEDDDVDRFDTMRESARLRFTAAGTPRPGEGTPLVALELWLFGEAGFASGVTGGALAIACPSLARDVADRLLAEHVAQRVLLRPAWRSHARGYFGASHVVVQPLDDRPAQVHRLVGTISDGIGHLLAREAARHLAEAG